MAEYALNNFSANLEQLRKGKISVDEYNMDLTGVFPKFEEKENPYTLDLTNAFVSSMESKTREEKNPYIIDLTSIFEQEIEVKKQEKKNPYVLDLTDLFKDGIELKKKNVYEMDIERLFPPFEEVQYNPYTMDIKSLSRKEEIHIKQELSRVLENYVEYQLNNTKQEQEAIRIIMDKYGMSMEKIKSKRPSVVKIDNILFVPIDFLESIERIFRQNNIVID
jgi:hypothetical protein